MENNKFIKIDDGMLCKFDWESFVGTVTDINENTFNTELRSKFTTVKTARLISNLIQAINNHINAKEIMELNYDGVDEYANKNLHISAGLYPDTLEEDITFLSLPDITPIPCLTGDMIQSFIRYVSKDVMLFENMFDPEDGHCLMTAILSIIRNDKRNPLAYAEVTDAESDDVFLYKFDDVRKALQDIKDAIRFKGCPLYKEIDQILNIGSGDDDIVEANFKKELIDYESNEEISETEFQELAKDSEFVDLVKGVEFKDPDEIFKSSFKLSDADFEDLAFEDESPSDEGISGSKEGGF